MIFKQKIKTLKLKAGGEALQHKEGGYLVVLLLIFGAIFFTIFTAFMGFTITGSKVSNAKLNSEQALQIAEAGLNYYKWFLAHYPNDMQNGTGEIGPYIMPFSDPEGDVIGEYSIEVDGNLACGSVTSVDITSTGYTQKEPNTKRVVRARYARPNVAEFSHIVNANVWAGDDRIIYGPYHSNGFVRMDGLNNSKVTSGQASALCQNLDICTSPPQYVSNNTSVNGVFGSGANSDLWESSVPPVSFTGVTVDLSDMKTRAINSGGRYYGPSGNGGYYVVFNSNGTYTLRIVRSNKSRGNAWGHQKNFLNNATTVGTYAIPSTCGLLFFEDNVWVQGVINGKVTVASAAPNSTTDPRVVIVGNITYANNDSGLLLIAEENINIGLDVPDNMMINGIFVAQKGKFHRPHYYVSSSNSVDSDPDYVRIQNSMSEYIYRNSLTTNGTVVSNGRVGTKWICSNSLSSWYCNGFEYRYDYNDRNLAIDPPPLTPKTSDNYQFIEWREEE